MSRRNGTFVVAAVLLAAFLPTAPQTLAGEHVRSGHQVVIQSLPAPVSGVRPAAATVNISIAAAAPAPTANEAAYVNLAVRTVSCGALPWWAARRPSRRG